MICLYLAVALFSCDLAQSAGVPLWYKEIESLLADDLSSNEAGEVEPVLIAITSTGKRYSGTFTQLKQQLFHGSDEGQYVEFGENINFDKAEGVLGPDTRHLQSPDSYPFTAMGRMGMFQKDCTGTFISPHVVLTAAHCVYKFGAFPYDGFNLNLSFYRGRCLPYQRGVLQHWSVVFLYQKWKRFYNYPQEGDKYDIAWIVYKTPSPAYMPYTSAMPPVGTQISIYGYPEDKNRDCLWGSSNPLMEIFQNVLIYNVDTAGGMSGSAVYYYDRGNPVIIGVHAGGYSAGYNVGTRMTASHKAVSDSIISVYN